MNAIQKIMAESKTLKQAAEKVYELATKVGHPMADAKLFVQEYKNFTETGEAMAEELLAKVYEYNREQTRLSLERKTPIDMINKAIAYKDEQLAQFFEKASKDPYYQFSWGDSAVKTAAQRKVYLEIREWLSTPTSLERWQEIIKHISGEARRQRLFCAQPEIPSPARHGLQIGA